MQSISISRRKLSVSYDPVLLAATKLKEAIKTAGYRIDEEESAPASPLTDALSNTLRSQDET